MVDGEEPVGGGSGWREWEEGGEETEGGGEDGGEGKGKVLDGCAQGGDLGLGAWRDLEEFGGVEKEQGKEKEREEGPN